VVQEVPFVTGQYSSQAGITGGTVTPFQTVQQQEVGTVLKVTPTISAEGNAVMLKLDVENSSVLNGASTSLTGDPTTEKRSISTNVLIENGGIVVLGGLISNEQDRTHDSVPFLGDIPLIGLLFKTRNDSATRDNLMIFIKPTILRDQSEAAYQTGRTYDYILGQEASMPPEQFPQLLRGEPVPRLPPLPPPPPPGTLSAPSPLAPEASSPKKPAAKGPPAGGRTAPAQNPQAQQVPQQPAAKPGGSATPAGGEPP
jgi:general secretion pathway protein D